MKRFVLAFLILGTVLAQAREGTAESYEAALDVSVALPNDPNLGDYWSSILDDARSSPTDIAYARLFDGIQKSAQVYFANNGWKCEMTVINYDEGDPSFTVKVADQARQSFEIYSRFALGQLPNFPGRASVVETRLLCDGSVIHKCTRNSGQPVIDCKPVDLR